MKESGWTKQSEMQSDAVDDKERIGEQNRERWYVNM